MMVGAYSVNNSLVDVVVLIVFGFAGYWLRKHEYEVAPLVLGLVLGPIFENSFRQSIILSQGDFTVFITRPLSAVFVIAALALPAAPMVQKLWRVARPRKSSPAEQRKDAPLRPQRTQRTQRKIKMEIPNKDLTFLNLSFE